MSLAEFDQDDADLGPASRVGLHLVLDGQPLPLGDPEVVRAWLHPPCWAGTGRLSTASSKLERATKKPGGITGFVLVVQSHPSVHPLSRRAS